MEIGNITYQIDVRDFAGQLSYNLMNEAILNQKNTIDFANNSTLILYIHNMVQSQSLAAIKSRWIPLIEKAYKNQNMKYDLNQNSFLIGNKMDLHQPDNPEHVKIKAAEGFGFRNVFFTSATPEHVIFLFCFD